MIVKVQLPLASSLPQEEWLALIYNKDRSYDVMVPIDAAIKDRMGDSIKKFFSVRVWNGKITWSQATAVEDQGW